MVRVIFIYAYFLEVFFFIASYSEKMHQSINQSPSQSFSE